MSLIQIERKVLEKNDTIANENRNIFKDRNIFVLNMISSPGSGKTSIIEQIIPNLLEKFKVAVVEGDVQTDLDARRVDALGVPVVQIVTNGGCHLEAGLVRDAISNFSDLNFNMIIIENVGNLVCPAGWDLGEDLKMTVISVTEGEDKPLKYPAVFRNSEVVIINKIDLLPYLKFSIDVLKKNILQINPKVKIFETSCFEKTGIDDLCEWISRKLKI